ncbi:MAG: PHP domain-containing protein [Ruminococcaceae bacterium]|nr:PHP domain-containing protein [Oscillospiraceae bacterium]
MLAKMDYNYHTHTYRCGHADGTEREYIEAALSVGIREMGFSDHAPWIDPSLGKEREYVVPYAKVGDYMDTVRALREEYKDRITLYVGFEAEHHPADPEELISLGAEYLILGQHFIKAPNGQYVHVAVSRYGDLISYYADAVVAGMRSGYYTYVAHPDVFNPVEVDPLVYQREMVRICEASAETGVPLEMNFLGIRQRRYYPTEAFWELAGKTGAPVTFGLDAHGSLEAKDVESLPMALALVEKYQLNYIGKPKLVLF